MDFKHNSITLFGEKLPLWVRKDYIFEDSVCTACNVTVPPNSEAVFPAHAHRKETAGDCLVESAVLESGLVPEGLIVGRTLVDASKHNFPVRIFNPVFFSH